jgi:gliding motility-associated-like protein
MINYIISFAFAILIFENNGLSQTVPNRKQNSSHVFIENEGQIVDQNGKPNLSVKYLLPVAAGMNLQLKANSFSYETYTFEDTGSKRSLGENDLRNSRKLKSVTNRFHFHRVDVTFANANSSPQMTTEVAATYYYNYYNNKSDRNLVKVHSYKRITYKDIYPSVDLVFDCSDGGKSETVEYYFVVKPGGDPGKIQLHFAGANKTRLKENHIEISVDKGKWHERIPESYLQSGNTLTKQRSVAAKNVRVNFKQDAPDTYGFDMGAYDHSQTLIIDPTPDLIWGTYLGDFLNDWSYSIAKDGNGNVFIGGSTNNSRNIATSGAYKTVIDGFSDAILGKFTSDGQLLWMTYFGGSQEDAINGLATDNNNNIVAVGFTFSSDNISTPNSYKPVKISPDWQTDAFIVKFTNDGSLQWATYYGGDSITFSSAIAIDKNNNIYITAWTNSANGIATPGAYQTKYGGGSGLDAIDGCIAKFNSAGAILWSTYYGDNSFDKCFGIALDRSANVYVTGITYSHQNISTPGAYQAVFGGGVMDAFIVKFNTDGIRQWASYYGGTGDDYANSVCTDSKDNVFICGASGSLQGIATPGSQQTAYGGENRDGFFAKFTPAGKRLWGSYLGGEGEEDLNAITTDDLDNIAITGSTFSTKGFTTPGSYQPTLGIEKHWTTFLSFFSNDGMLQWGTYYGKTGAYGDGNGYALVASADYIYVTGETMFTENIATCDAFQTNWSGNQDAFLAKFGKNEQLAIPAISISSDNDGVICKGQEVNFMASVQNMGNNYSFQWYWNGNPVGTNQAVYSNNQLSEKDSIRCLVQKAAACLQQPYNSNSIIIEIDPALPVSVTIAGPSSAICQGVKSIFTATPTNAGNKPGYQWKVNGVNEGPDSSSFITTNLINGDQVTCTITHHGACNMDSVAISNTVTIIVKPIPAPSIMINTSANPVCSGTPVLFTAVAANTGNNPAFQWELNGEKVDSDSNSYTNSGLSNGDQIDCMLIANASGCTSDSVRSNIITETVFTKPDISIWGDSVITKGASAQIQSTATGTVISYQWTPESSLNSSVIPNPIATPVSTTSYMLQVTDADGCISSKGFTVMVITKIMVPNAFSPNGDGKNDLFRPIYGSDISQVILNVYNRWGQLIFEDRGTHKGWDGNFGGKPQPEGTYIWELRYKTSSGESKSLAGSFLLIK